VRFGLGDVSDGSGVGGHPAWLAPSLPRCSGSGVEVLRGSLAPTPLTGGLLWSLPAMLGSGRYRSSRSLGSLPPIWSDLSILIDSGFGLLAHRLTQIHSL